ITIALCLVSFAGFSYHYFNVYPQDSAHNWQAGYEQLAKKVCAYQNKVDKIWIQLTDQRFFLWPLAYCEYSQGEFNKFEFNDHYYLAKMNNIYFDKNDFTNEPGRVLLVTDNSHLDSSSVIESKYTFGDNKQVFFIWKNNHEK
ncbi:MAG: hypothetical protein U9O78_04440, partial [Patescibacteria group bacterium]|nr:hypothetical protein [Patescibacteria group bacterium]